MSITLPIDYPLRLATKPDKEQQNSSQTLLYFFHSSGRPWALNLSFNGLHLDMHMYRRMIWSNVLQIETSEVKYAWTLCALQTTGTAVMTYLKSDTH